MTLLNRKGRPILPTARLRGLPVHNDAGDKLGVLKDLVIETYRGTVAYVVMKFDDDKSFALPYSVLTIDPEAMTIHADIQREVFEHGRGMIDTEQDESR